MHSSPTEIIQDAVEVYNKYMYSIRHALPEHYCDYGIHTCSLHIILRCVYYFHYREDSLPDC